MRAISTFPPGNIIDVCTSLAAPFKIVLLRGEGKRMGAHATAPYLKFYHRVSQESFPMGLTHCALFVHPHGAVVGFQSTGHH